MSKAQSSSFPNVPVGKITGVLPVANGGTATTSSTSSASTGVIRDANGNINVNGVNNGYTTTVTAAGTTTLTVASTNLQYFTGSSVQTVVLPVTSTLVLGQRFILTNNSTAIITVNSSGGNLTATMQPSDSLIVTCILTSGTTAASWDAKIAATPGYTLQLYAGQDAAPSDNGTLYLGTQLNQTTPTTARCYIPVNGTITKVVIWITVGTGGSNEAATVAIRLNNTTDTVISSAVDFSANNVYTSTALGIAVVGNFTDYIAIKFNYPTWATNPVNIRASAIVYIQI